MIQKGINQLLGLSAGLAISGKSAVNKANVTTAKSKGVMVDNPVLAKNKKVPNISSNQSILQAQQTQKMLGQISPQQARQNFIKLGQIQVQERLSLKKFMDELKQRQPGLGESPLTKEVTNPKTGEKKTVNMSNYEVVAKQLSSKERKDIYESWKGGKK